MGSFIISSPALAAPAELAPDLLVLIERGRRSLGLPRSHRLAQLLDDLEELATGSVVVKESVTAARAAAELGVSPRRMRQLAERSELGAERRGGRWFFDAQAVKERAESSVCCRFPTDRYRPLPLRLRYRFNRCDERARDR